MALEPRTVSLVEGENSELRRHDAALLDQLALTIPVLASRHGRYASRPALVTLSVCTARRRGFELVLATPVVLWGGWPFFVRGWQSIVNRSLNMFTLIGLGVGVAYVYSVVATLVPGHFPDVVPRLAAARCASTSRPRRSSSRWCLLGQVLELGAQPDRRGDPSACSASRPRPRACVREDGTEDDVPLDQVAARRSPARASRRERFRSTASCSKVRAASTNR